MEVSKKEVLDLAANHLFPNRMDMFGQLGVEMVIGRREGYRFWDVDGREFMDFHLNGGTYSLGHRNPELLSVLMEAFESIDVGNHHFANPPRAELARRLAEATGLHYAVFTPSGSEAIDVAIRSARRATGRRKIVSLDCGFHGRTGLAAQVGDPKNAAVFHSDNADEFVVVSLDDLDAVEAALKNEDVAAVVLETIPATAGFPVPNDAFLPGVRTLCDRYGSLYIADEVQAGLGRTGKLWAIENWGVQPDILITGKGLSGGLYPVAAAVLSEKAGAWLQEDGWGYVSTFGGAEPGCRVGIRALELCSAADTLANVEKMSERFAAGFKEIQSRRSMLKGVRQTGLVIGLEVDMPSGGMMLTQALYRTGIWAMFAGFDPGTMQFKPGLLVDEAYCDEALGRLDDALGLLQEGRAA